VHQARRVDRGQAFGQPRGQRKNRGGGQRPVLADRLRQRRPGHVGRGQPGCRTVHVGIHHRGREQAAYLARGGDLAPEPGPELGIGGQFGADDLHRYQPPTRGKAQEHLPHAAAAQLHEQTVWSDSLRIRRLQRLYHAKPHPNASN